MFRSLKSVLTDGSRSNVSRIILLNVLSGSKYKIKYSSDAGFCQMGYVIPRRTGLRVAASRKYFGAWRLDYMPNNKYILAQLDQAAETIFVGSSCNQNCDFCFRTDMDEMERYAPEIILQKLREAKATKNAVFFVGGEPTLNRRLSAYIRYADELRFDTIGIETNGLLLSYERYAKKIVASGLTHVTIMLPSHKPEISDSATRLIGGWEIVCKGIEALQGTGVETAILTPVLKRSFRYMDQHIRFIAKSFPHVKSVILQPVSQRDGHREFIPAAELEEALSKALQASMESGVVALFRLLEAPAPCLFRDIDKIKAFFMFPPFYETAQKKGFQRIDMCDDCMLRSRCRGIHPQFGSNENTSHYAVSPEFARHAFEEWSDANSAEQVRGSWKNDMAILSGGNNGVEKTREELLLRINYSCNQNCLFCFVDHKRDNMSAADFDAFSQFLNSQEPCDIIISGGEPTLCDSLVERLKKIKKANPRSVSLQTNAVLLHRKERAEELARAGLDFAVVSLHSHDPVISGVLTGSRDSFEKTIQGIINLRECGVSVFISHVINSLNYKSLSDFVRFSASELGCAPVAFSSTEAMSLEDTNKGFMPRHTEIKYCLASALDLCYELRVPFFRLASKSGFPLCLLNGDSKYYHDAVFVGDSCSSMPNMIKTQACSVCGLSDYCFGINRFYAMHHGLGELCPSEKKDFKPIIQYQRASQTRWFDHIVQQWLQAAEFLTQRKTRIY